MTLNLPDQEICEKYLNGMFLYQLAEEYRCHQETIIKRICDNGFKLRTKSEVNKGHYLGSEHQQYIDLPIEEISVKFLNEMNTTELAEEYQCSAQTISNRLYEYGINVLEESYKHQSATHQGIPYDEWESFASESLYCPAFNEKCKESNREKYNRKCFLTGLPEEENIGKDGKQRKLSVHHVDMDKGQGCDGVRWKLVPLSMWMHNKTHNELWKSRIIWLLNNVWD
jgi:hypothetical protein